MIFANRQEAGEKLAEKLIKFKNRADAIVLGLPRGGVMVAFAAARRLNLPLDIIVPRKIGAPGNEELAIGAIGENGELVLDEALAKQLGVTPKYLAKIVAEEKEEAQRRLRIYRNGRPPLSLDGKTAILVDDGIATGSTMLAAIRSAKNKKAKKIIAAAPIVAMDTLAKLKNEADDVICIDAPAYFGAVGAFYREFGQTQDSEVVETLQQKRGDSF